MYVLITLEIFIYDELSASVSFVGKNSCSQKCVPNSASMSNYQLSIILLSTDTRQLQLATLLSISLSSYTY